MNLIVQPIVRLTVAERKPDAAERKYDTRVFLLRRIENGGVLSAVTLYLCPLPVNRGVRDDHVRSERDFQHVLFQMFGLFRIHISSAAYCP